MANPVLSPTIHGNQSTAVMVVWLSGTGSSGKSSLGKAIEQIDSKWRYIEEDKSLIYEVEQEITRGFPDQVEKIKKCVGNCGVFQALKEIDRAFDFAPEHKQDALTAVAEIKTSFNNNNWKERFRKIAYPRSNESVYKEIKQAVAEGKNVLLDGWGLTREKIQSINSNLKILHGLIYTSIEQCYEFLEKRNLEAVSQGDLRIQRFSGTLFRSFTQLYELSSQSTERTIETIDYNKLSEFLNEKTLLLKDEGCENYLHWNEIPLTYFQGLRNQLFSPVDESHRTYYLQPKESYDFVFKESGNSSERAVKLLDLLKNTD